MGAGEGSGAGLTGKKLLEIVLCIVLPPLAVRGQLRKRSPTGCRCDVRTDAELAVSAA